MCFYKSYCAIAFDRFARGLFENRIAKSKCGSLTTKQNRRLIHQESNKRRRHCRLIIRFAIPADSRVVLPVCDYQFLPGSGDGDVEFAGVLVVLVDISFVIIMRILPIVGIEHNNPVELLPFNPIRCCDENAFFNGIALTEVCFPGS